MILVEGIRCDVFQCLSYRWKRRKDIERMAKKNTYDAGSIAILEGLEAVRKRPGMYIGSVSTKGLNHLIYEIVDNAVDEHLAGYCSEIHVTLEKDGSATIADNGRGVPVDLHATGVSAARVVYTTLHAGGKFDDSAYKTSGGLHGVGSSVVNALSTYMDVQISRDGYIHHDRYEQGKPVIELEDGLLPTIGKTRKTGTKVNFLPDDTIFEKTKFKAEEVKSRLHETAYLNPDLKIVFEDKRGAEPEQVIYHEPDGILGFIRELNHKKEVVHDPVYFKGEAEGIEVEVAFQYVNEFHENVLGFCNNIYNAEGGPHLTGFKTTFTTAINQYARELGILKEKDANFTGADVRNGMTAVVSIKHPDPRFEGQTKTKLDNQDASRATAKITGDEIQLYFDKNLDKARYLYSFLFKNKYPRYQINLKLSQIDFVQISYYRYSFYPSKYLVNGSGNKIVFKFNMLDGSQYIIENLVSSDKETFSKGIELMKKNGVRFVDSYHLLDIIRSNKNLDQYIVAIEKEKKHD